MERDISRPVTRKDHYEKIRGEAVYVGDHCRALDGGRLLEAVLLRAPTAHGSITGVSVPPLPEGYSYIDAGDCPRNIAYYPANDLPPSTPQSVRDAIRDNMPLFADKSIEYFGQPVGMLVGPDKSTLRGLAAGCHIEYTELPAVIPLEESAETLLEYERSLGNPEAAFLNADFVFERTYYTGRQYQAYLETQGVIAEPEGDGRLLIHGAMQCPFTVRESVAYTLDRSGETIHVKQDTVGGAFGGKEDYPSFIAAQAAVASRKTGCAVRLTLDRSEDFQFAYKRHPSLTRVRAAVKSGRVTAMDIDGRLDAGAFITSSCDVLMRYCLTFPGVYSIPDLHVRVRAMKTNTPPTGAFRGFGGPQSEFAMEMLMSQLAKELGEDEVGFKKRHFARKGSVTSTGGAYYYDVPLEHMLELADKSTSYFAKHARYSKQRGGRLRSGIGVAFSNHGCPLGWNAEWEYIKPRVRIAKDAAGRVTVFTGQTELGQGIRTVLAKIAAQELGIPVEDVSVDNVDSDTTGNTGPTAASRSVVCVGMVVRQAAAKLKAAWSDGEAQEFWAEYARPAHTTDFDDTALVGNYFDDFSWSVVIVEVVIDPYSGDIRITNAHGVYDVGTPIDLNILTGQMEGGLLQALGYSASECMVYGGNGRMFNTSFSDYTIPTATDIPNISVEFERSEYPEGPFGAKGAGELPLVGVSAAYLLAVEQAMESIRPVSLTRIPFFPENVLKILSGMERRNG